MKSNYRHEEIAFSKLKENIVLPKFQRSLVWSKEKKRNFIDTILKGDPCGVLLLYKTEDLTYTLVDGLQRYSTLVDFCNNPVAYIDIAKQYADNVDSIINLLPEVGGDATNFKKNIVKTIENNFKLGTNPINMKNDVLAECPLLKDSFEIAEKLIDLYYEMNKDFDISQFSIQTIVYTGDFNNLPEIFANMNSNGTQLSKYDVYAALWHNIRFDVEDEELLLAVEEKYNDMIDSTDIDIETYEHGSLLDEKELNLYEFCVAIGRVLRKNYPCLFPNVKKTKQKYDSFGFNLLAAILTNHVQHKDKLPTFFENISVSDISTFTKQIDECTGKLNQILQKYTKPFYDDPVFKYIESQMVCMITTIFKLYYEYSGSGIRFAKIVPDTKVTAQLKSNLPKRYLYDIVVNHWGNSTDKKIDFELDLDMTYNRFLKSIPMQQWRLHIGEWLENQEKDNKKGIQVENKLFINYILSMKGTPLNNSEHEYKIECVVPREKIYKKIKNCTGKYSISNLAVIPVISLKRTKLNEGKTIFEISCKEKDNDLLLDELLYPRWDDISFAIDEDNLTSSAWVSYLHKRRNMLIEKFCELIKND